MVSGDNNNHCCSISIIIIDAASPSIINDSSIVLLKSSTLPVIVIFALDFFGCLVILQTVVHAPRVRRLIIEFGPSEVLL